MNESFLLLSKIIRSRRAVFPQSYEQGLISDEILMEILENARWAPTHKKTQPWRFKIFKNNTLQELSEFLEEHYKQNTLPENFSEIKMKKAGERPLQSSAVIAICIERSPESLIPAWEETAAVACAVQNIWLGCSALGIGSYWSTPGAIKDLPLRFKLNNGIECIGLFYMGWMKKNLDLPSERKALEEFIL
ncbi:MAG: nitroreductase [Saprospiraceae bacterium]|nr:nitroreductase [Saprospiraceae bacterium]